MALPQKVANSSAKGRGGSGPGTRLPSGYSHPTGGDSRQEDQIFQNRAVELLIVATVLLGGGGRTVMITAFLQAGNKG